jgi:hypothetical protein
MGNELSQLLFLAAFPASYTAPANAGLWAELDVSFMNAK